jgi:hypothetical protein
MRGQKLTYSSPFLGKLNPKRPLGSTVTEKRLNIK